MSAAQLVEFTCFEDLIDHFVDSTGVFFPRLTEGQASFFSGFSRWFATPRHQKKPGFAMILPDPAQGLAFPNAFDVLAPVMGKSRQSVSRDDVIALLAQYSLPPAILTQPVSTLSGGELLLLNYAKASAQTSFVTGLKACNPVFWLNPVRYHLWNSLCDCYQTAGLTAEALVLKGDVLAGDQTMPEQAAISSLPFHLQISRPVVQFDEIQFPVFHPARTISFFVDGDESFSALSPMIITGDNGVGKSLFARLLAGVLNVSAGRVRTTATSGSRIVRLLFQESISQLFAMNLHEHRRSVFAAFAEGRTRAEELFNDLLVRVCGDSDYTQPDRRSDTLLAAKIGLISERLAESPALLLLDEPGWGLSRDDACKLVYHTTAVAHSLGTAVAIISHQPQWHAIAAGNLCLSRISADEVQLKFHAMSAIS